MGGFYVEPLTKKRKPAKKDAGPLTSGVRDELHHPKLLSRRTSEGDKTPAGRRPVHRRLRHAMEMAWILGPVALQGEYVKFRFTDLEPVGTSPQGAEFYSWNASAIFFLTGERMELKDTTVQPVTPRKNFNPETGHIGAIGIAIRLEHFSGDEDWILQNAYASVRKADAFSIALNWIMTPLFGLILDYTATNLSDPIRVRVNPKDGSIDYIEEEHVITTRFHIDF